MTDRPITFSAPMVRAILDGRKTQTRRILKDVPPQPSDDAIVHAPSHDHAYFDSYCGARKTPANPRGMSDTWCWWTRDDRAGHGCKVRFVPGDRLYVREHWNTPTAYDDLKPSEMGGEEAVRYLADGTIVRLDAGDRTTIFGRHRQAMHMPRWASRITLIVEDVRVQRLKDISEADAIAEGIERASLTSSGQFYRNYDNDGCPIMAYGAYRSLWNILHGPDAWDANPWVVAVSFAVFRCNIDNVEAIA